MRYYEIVLIIHPDSDNQIDNLVNYYSEIIINSTGKIHRLENWGRRQLAYAIKNLNKAYYLLLNIEISKNILDILDNDFRFNEIILRYLIMRTKNIIVDPSAMVKKKDDNNQEGNNSTVCI
ncbi:30S ribosomal subunit protein S6 [Candidatus Blochmanniella floridana]|uniref:Small ribosomal subunit protein bS6 n=1 Tax=Blochmanniella floridana TaxID=203907 RepID=RS6_BLOFL|nr:RecName: Full=Small ribosomal subunit protein bS6; AltName: Full=30S ribosomal protein S6 [Candidatus Blochmannia floridanus]CAD83608.1 30S ribosomal subunit protein S6 [Candidatus Blochmannia floridanus]